MDLKEYHRKRDFKKTAEPRGKKLARKGFSFVIQKHAASRLHYDFRLELGGVLLSWAVPKGPSLDPSQKRLAMHVEDHPVDYGGFEGIIPQGEYGGGTVMLWDRGTWEPLEDDPFAGHRAGKLKIRLHGEKLHGGWMLVRKGGSRTDNQTEKTWFLIKERDDYARSSEQGDILEEEPLSVTTGRDLDEIAADQDRVWGSNRGKTKVKAVAKASRKTAKKSKASSRAIAKRKTSTSRNTSAVKKKRASR